MAAMLINRWCVPWRHTGTDKWTVFKVKSPPLSWNIHIELIYDKENKKKVLHNCGSWSAKIRSSRIKKHQQNEKPQKFTPVNLIKMAFNPLMLRCIIHWVEPTLAHSQLLQQTNHTLLAMLIKVGTGKREPESRNEFTAVIRIRIQNGWQNQEKGVNLTDLTIITLTRFLE